MVTQNKFIIKEPIELALNIAEQLELDAVLPDYTGQHIIQLAHDGCFNLSKSPIKQQVCIAKQWPCLQESIPTIVGDFTELPILAESIDVIVLPHVLEFEDDCKHLLRELWRVLAPEGHAIITGYHISCLWGMPQFVKQHFAKQALDSKLMNSNKLRKLLLNMGFQLVNFKTFFYRPPINKSRLLKHLGPIEILGQFLWPYLGCIYMFTVKKPVVALTPTFASQRKLRLRVKGVMEPTARRTKTKS